MMTVVYFGTSADAAASRQADEGRDISPKKKAVAAKPTLAARKKIISFITKPFFIYTPRIFVIFYFLR
jgi:hypothetical protein